MPIPKEFQKLFGQLVGHFINQGDSFTVAKHKADKIIRQKMREKKKRKTK